jgi:DNA-binding LytR/AlgR family response regulator
MVNASRVAEVRPAMHGEYLIVLSDGVEIPTGRRFRDAVHGLVRQAR